MTRSRRRAARLLALCAAPCLALAAWWPAAAGTGIQGGRVSLLLLAALAGLAATTHRWRGWLSGRRQGSVRRAAISVVERHTLGQGNEIHLVEVAGQRLLLGSSTGRVALLARLDEVDCRQPSRSEARTP